jgi:hypothetical protein
LRGTLKKADTETEQKCFFSRDAGTQKTNTKAKRKERLVASIYELNIQKSNLNKTTRKREETYLN